MSNEIEILGKLNSQHVINLYGVIHTKEFLYLITEMGGVDLFEFFDEHPEGVSEDWAKTIVFYILDAVNFVHSKSYCHRDLKPENILLKFDPSTNECLDLKLCDFGLATKFSQKDKLNEFCGSPGFFAPEMILSASYYGDKVDVWSVGKCCLSPPFFVVVVVVPISSLAFFTFFILFAMP